MLLFAEWRKITSALVDLILPKTCINCGIFTLDVGICGQCWSKLVCLSTNACTRCYFQFPQIVGGEVLCGKCDTSKYYLDSIRAPFKYNSAIKKMILKYKNHGYCNYVQVFVKIISRRIVLCEYDYVVAVPLHRIRLIWRGYNQSEILASHLALNLGITHYPNLLKRDKFTKSQKYFTRDQRSDNIKGVFSVKNRDLVKNAKILLVDDVYTTGSTLEECAKVLKRAGAKEVHGVVIAKT